MNREIPVLFEGAIVSSSEQLMENSTISMSRAKVRVFSKYGNRNHSYITDTVADSLIESAIDQPIVGWYDAESQSWAGHVGNKIAQAYGYIESFLGWEPFADTDGIEREYAVFSVVLFNKYFSAANHIIGANQSMELDPDSIDGDWAEMDNGEEYFVYTKAKIFSFCVIGTHEPCFSASAFFTKNTSSFDELKSLVFEMRNIAEKFDRQGGDKTMENEIITPEAEVTEEVVEQSNVEDFTAETEPQPVVEPASEQVEEPVDYEAKFNEAVTEMNSLNAALEELNTRIQEYEANNASITAQLSEATASVENLQQQIANYEQNLRSIEAELASAKESISNYELADAQREADRKEALLASYANDIDTEDLDAIHEGIANFSYDDLESKLAVTFARQTRARKESEENIPLVNTPKSAFAVLMEKYKKN